MNTFKAFDDKMSKDLMNKIIQDILSVYDLEDEVNNGDLLNKQDLI
jgi:hypothetical protein